LTSRISSFLFVNLFVLVCLALSFCNTIYSMFSLFYVFLCFMCDFTFSFHDFLLSSWHIMIH
jgi:hypothetical protein